jgi:hypothetical protein
MMLGKLGIYRQKNFFFTLYHVKTRSGSDTVRPKTVRENIEGKLHDIEFRNDL